MHTGPADLETLRNCGWSQPFFVVGAPDFDRIYRRFPPFVNAFDKDVIEALAQREKFILNIENQVLYPAMRGFEDAPDGVGLASTGSALDDGARTYQLIGERKSIVGVDLA